MDSLIVSDGELTERALATARWARPGEIAARAFKPGSVWLGRAADDHETPVGNADDRHVLVVAGSRAGKGASIIIPTLCTWPGSIVVIDPKGENATVAAARRGGGSVSCVGLDQHVFVLDPFKAARISDDLRATFNPLDALDPADEETVDEAGRLADALVVSQNQTDPYWDDQARALIKALILYVVTEPHFEGRRSLVSVRKLITTGDVIKRDELKEQFSEESDLPSAFAILFSGMSESEAFDGIVSGAGQSFAHLMVHSSKTFSSVLSAAGNHTEFIDSLPMQRVLNASTPGFNLRKLKTDPGGMSLFLSLPQRFMNTHFRWFRLMVSMIITEMEKTPGRPATGFPILMALDEFAGLKKMDVIENATAQIAGFGVKMMFIVQTLTQLKTVYGHNWEVFIANAGTKIFFGIDDNFSRDYISKHLGEVEVSRTTQSKSMTEGTTTGETTGKSVSTGSSTSSTSGGSKGVSQTSGASVNSDIGLFWDTARTVSRSVGRSVNSGSSWSSSTSSNSGSSTSTSTSFGESKSETAGLSQAIHKRPLLTSDEVGQVFSRIDDPSNAAYPGLALVAATGTPPLIVRRVSYFEDDLFDQSFDPHPDHPVAVRRRPKVIAATIPVDTDDDMARELEAYYGGNALRLALSYYGKLRYEDASAPLVAKSGIAFAKDILDALAAFNKINAKYGRLTTVEAGLVDPTFIDFLRENRMYASLSQAPPFAHPRVRKQFILEKKIKDGTITPRERFVYFCRYVRRGPVIMIVYPAIIAFVFLMISTQWKEDSDRGFVLGAVIVLWSLWLRKKSKTWLAVIPSAFILFILGSMAFR